MKTHDDLHCGTYPNCEHANYEYCEELVTNLLIKINSVITYLKEVKHDECVRKKGKCLGEKGCPPFLAASVLEMLGEK